jgi:hypothetical protein
VILRAAAMDAAGSQVALIAEISDLTRSHFIKSLGGESECPQGLKPVILKAV